MSGRVKLAGHLSNYFGGSMIEHPSNRTSGSQAQNTKDLLYLIQQLKSISEKLIAWQSSFNTESLSAKDVNIERLRVRFAEILQLVVDNVEAEKLSAKEATIDRLSTGLVDVSELVAKIASVENLQAADAEVKRLKAHNVEAENTRGLISGTENNALWAGEDGRLFVPAAEAGVVSTDAITLTSRETEALENDAFSQSDANRQFVIAIKDAHLAIDALIESFTSQEKEIAIHEGLIKKNKAAIEAIDKSIIALQVLIEEVESAAVIKKTDEPQEIESVLVFNSGGIAFTHGEGNYLFNGLYNSKEKDTLELGDIHRKLNINSKKRPTVTLIDGKEALAYKSEVEHLNDTITKELNNESERLNGEVERLDGEIKRLNNLGAFIKSFDDYKSVFHYIEDFAPLVPKVNDFITVRKNENKGGTSTRHLISDIKDGVITWELDVIYNVDISGKMDLVPDAKTGSIAVFDDKGQVVDATVSEINSKLLSDKKSNALIQDDYGGLIIAPAKLISEDDNNFLIEGEDKKLFAKPVTPSSLISANDYNALQLGEDKKLLVKPEKFISEKADNKLVIDQYGKLYISVSRSDLGNQIEGEGRCLMRVLLGIDSAELTTQEQANEAIKEVVIKLRNPRNYRKVMIADYLDRLDLSGMTVMPPVSNAANAPQAWNDTYKNNRILIAGINSYKHTGNPEITQSHIVFAFRNNIARGGMHTANNASGGYPSMALRIWLDSQQGNGSGAFAQRLIAALGGDNPLLTMQTMTTISPWTPFGTWVPVTVFLPGVSTIFGIAPGLNMNANNDATAVHLPLYRDSSVYGVRRWNGARDSSWLITLGSSQARFGHITAQGLTMDNQNNTALMGISPIFCIGEN
jgi:hypothetical protein